MMNNNEKFIGDYYLNDDNYHSIEDYTKLNSAKFAGALFTVYKDKIIIRLENGREITL